jgi:hypothetical protein
MLRKQNTAPTHRLHLRLSGWATIDWSDRFDGLSVRLAEDGSTVICGELKDQSALFGLLRSVESRGMKVIACFAYPGGVA